MIPLQIQKYFCSLGSFIGHLRKCFPNYEDNEFKGLAPGEDPIKIVS